MTAPSIYTGGATDVTGMSAVINGTVSSNGLETTVGFIIGGGIGAAIATPSVFASEAEMQSFTGLMEGLEPGVEYWFYPFGTNSDGTTNGIVRYFTTPNSPAAITKREDNVVRTTTATLHGVVSTAGVQGTVTFEYGVKV